MSGNAGTPDAEYAEVMACDGQARQEVTFALAEAIADTVFRFAPEAFCCRLSGLRSWMSI
ncbi:MAG: hypothetical protein R3285_03105 [Kiloniellales bacterium]|nr:hypothetical protein [Kiloniellales bacterium]